MHGASDLHAATCRSLEPGPCRHAGCEQEAPASGWRAVRPSRESGGVFLKVSTWTCIFVALDEGAHAAAAPGFAALGHSDKSSPSHGHWHRRLVAGSGCAAQLETEHRLHVLELSSRSLRQDSANLSKQVAYWRRDAKRARADLQLAEQDTTKHRNKGYLVPRPSQSSADPRL